MSVSDFYIDPVALTQIIADQRKERVRRSLERALKPLHIWQFDEQHVAGRALQEVRLRNAPGRDVPAGFEDSTC